MSSSFSTYDLNEARVCSLLREEHVKTGFIGTLLNYSLGNLMDRRKNHHAVVNQLRINIFNGHHSYDVLVLINGLPCVQIDLKTLCLNPRRAIEQFKALNDKRIVFCFDVCHRSQYGENHKAIKEFFPKPQLSSPAHLSSWTMHRSRRSRAQPPPCAPRRIFSRCSSTPTTTIELLQAL